MGWLRNLLNGSSKCGKRDEKEVALSNLEKAIRENEVASRRRIEAYGQLADERKRQTTAKEDLAEVIERMVKRFEQ